LVWDRLTRGLVLSASVFVWLLVVAVTGQLLFGLLMVITGVAFLPLVASRSNSK